MSTIKGRPDLVGDLAKDLEVDEPGIGRGPGHDHLGAVLFGQVPDLVVVDGFGFPGNTVGDKVEQLAGEGDRRTVGQMASVGQAHGQDRVARIKAGKVDGHVGR
jgi:hypothetical protein